VGFHKRAIFKRSRESAIFLCPRGSCPWGCSSGKRGAGGVQQLRLRRPGVPDGVFSPSATFDPNFRLIVTKPDQRADRRPHFPPGLFRVVLTRCGKGSLNDRLNRGGGRDRSKKAESDRVWVWPDLVYTRASSR